MDTRKLDCLYYEDKEEDTGFHHCKLLHTLYKEDENNTMCRNCVLWDNYIPKSATEEQIKKAQEWQDKGFLDQEDYYEYFK